MRLLPCLACSISLLGPALAQAGERQPTPSEPVEPVPAVISSRSFSANSPATGVGGSPSYGQGDEASAPAPFEDEPPAAGGGAGGSAPVPEPSALFLVGTGLLGVALTARLRRRERRSAR